MVNSPDRIAELTRITPADCGAVFRQVAAYRYALWQCISGPQARSLRRARAQTIRALEAMTLAATELIHPEAKQTLIERRVPESRRYLRPLARYIVKRRSDRLLKMMKRSRADLGRLIRQTGVGVWAELERHARSPAAAERPVLSSRGIEVSRSLQQQWANLPLHRVRCCAFPRCDVAGGRYFLARTSERDCPICREAFSRDTRFRVRAGITRSPRRRG